MSSTPSFLGGLCDEIQFSTCFIAGERDELNSRRHLMVGSATSRVEETSSNTRYEQIVADQQLDSVVDLLLLLFQHLTKLLSLYNRSWEAIKDGSS